MTIADQLAALWRAGATQAAIARELRTSCNVIAGVVARARKRDDARFPLRAASPKGGRKPKPAPLVCKPAASTTSSRELSAKPAAVPPPAVPPPALKPQPAGLPLWCLEPRDCRYAVNSPEKGGDEYLFCGEPAIPGRPYCSKHAGAVRGPRPKGPALPRA